VTKVREALLEEDGNSETSLLTRSREDSGKRKAATEREKERRGGGLKRYKKEKPTGRQVEFRLQRPRRSTQRKR